MTLAEIYASLTPEQREKFNALRTINELNAFIDESKLGLVEHEKRELVECVVSGATPILDDKIVSPYFKHPDFFNMESHGSMTIIPKFRTYQQTTEVHCGPASALMVLYHFGVTDWDEMSIGDVMGTRRGDEDVPHLEDSNRGTTVSGMVRFFEHIGWHVESPILGDIPFKDEYGFRDWVIENLKAGVPIIVLWLDWGGHWQAIIGYDSMGTRDFSDDVLIVAEPYDTSDHLQDGYMIVNAERFFGMWFDTRFQPEGQQFQQWVIARPKD